MKTSEAVLALTSPILYSPSDSRSHEPMPLVVMFHGAGGRAEHMIDLMRPLADERRFRILAPTSRGATWDVIENGELGPDRDALLAALDRTCAEVSVNRVAVGGFSDGASYALTIGLAEGHRFDAVLAFSPGFEAAPEKAGRPRIFVAHGRKDAILPIDRCSRRIVPRLVRAGYDVLYEEFDGAHVVPKAMTRAALSFLVQKPPVARR
jgi:phospholipase/carboxylesterase